MHRSTYGCPETRQGATERRIGIRFEHCGVCDIGITPSYHFPVGVIKAIYRRNSNLFRKETGRRTGEASREHLLISPGCPGPWHILKSTDNHRDIREIILQEPVLPLLRGQTLNCTSLELAHPLRAGIYAALQQT